MVGGARTAVRTPSCSAFLSVPSPFARQDLSINFGSNAPSSGVISFVIALQYKSATAPCAFTAALFDNVVAQGMSSLRPPPLPSPAVPPDTAMRWALRVTGSTSSLQCTSPLSLSTACDVSVTVLAWQVAAIVCGIAVGLLILFFIGLCIYRARKRSGGNKADSRHSDEEDQDTTEPTAMVTVNVAASAEHPSANESAL